VARVARTVKSSRSGHAKTKTTGNTSISRLEGPGNRAQVIPERANRDTLNDAPSAQCGRHRQRASRPSRPGAGSSRGAGPPDAQRARRRRWGGARVLGRRLPARGPLVASGRTRPCDRAGAVQRRGARGRAARRGRGPGDIEASGLADDLDRRGRKRVRRSRRGRGLRHGAWRRGGSQRDDAGNPAKRAWLSDGGAHQAALRRVCRHGDVTDRTGKRRHGRPARRGSYASNGEAAGRRLRRRTKCGSSSDGRT
jgi:hypothetical protein